MVIRFNDFIKKAGQITGCGTQMELAKILEVNRSAITQAKNRDAVPERWLLTLARKYSLTPDWFESGNITPYSGAPTLERARMHEPEPDYNPEVIQIPKVDAILCAGGGSFEVGGSVSEYLTLPRGLVGFGRTDQLLFMDVAGDSMEPGICNGDTVLIDQSFDKAIAGAIMAVGHEESIFIKRIGLSDDGAIVLSSDNPAYSPIYLYGDDFESFRIIGKLVWLCRDLHR